MRRRDYNPSYAQRRADSRDDHMWKQDLALHQQADKIRFTTDEKVSAERERGRKEAERLRDQADKDTAAEEKRLLGTPITRWSGATSGPITLTHWRTPVAGRDDGPIAVLENGRVLPSDHDHPAMSVVREEVKTRYPVLPALTDRSRAATFFSHYGLTMDSTDTDTVQGVYGPADRKITRRNVPSLTKARVTVDGLELTYRHRPGDNSALWNGKLANLRAGFKASGVDAGNLSIHEDRDGNVVLRFDDAPSSFPRAVAPPAPTSIPKTRDDVLRRYSDAQWKLGVDARGNEVTFSMPTYPHALIVGGTGGGKSVWARSQLEYLRTEHSFQLFLSDGKASDFSALEGLPNVGWVAPNDDVAQLVLMLRTVEAEMDRRTAEAKRAKKDGKAAYNIQPILLLLDEWGSSSITLEQKFGKSEFKRVTNMVDRILRIGRETRIHVALSSQTIRKTGPGAVDGTWQANFGLTVSLGNPESVTVEYAFPAGATDRAKIIGPRLEGHPGRGMFYDTERGTVAEFQSYYGWSPGTTRLDANAPSNVKPPTPEVRAAWEAWKPISESTPWLAPRLGIKAQSPAWREDLDSILATEIVALTDQSGNVKPGMEKFDPMSEEWLGAVALDGGGAGVSLDGFADDHPTPPAPPRPAPQTVPESPSPAFDDTADDQEDEDVTTDDARREAVRQEALRMGILPADEMTDAERKEAIRQEAIKMGLIPPDDEPAADKLAADDDPEPESKTEPAPKTVRNTSNKPVSSGDDI